jgi:hypothetical protein
MRLCPTRVPGRQFEAQQRPLPSKSKYCRIGGVGGPAVVDRTAPAKTFHRQYCGLGIFNYLATVSLGNTEGSSLAREVVQLNFRVLHMSAQSPPV